jgi:hypothetical protein
MEQFAKPSRMLLRLMFYYHGIILLILEDGFASVNCFAFKARGFMDDEREWEFAMEEAIKTKMPCEIRRLFATIVAYCPVKDKQGKFTQQLYISNGYLNYHIHCP